MLLTLEYICHRQLLVKFLSKSLVNNLINFVY